MGIVVAKKIRLGKDGDKFKKNLVAAVLRTSVKIDKYELEKANELWKMSGIIYEIDEEKTKERNELLSKSDNSGSDKKAEREAAIARAKDLGIDFPKNIKTEKLLELIDEKLK